jgi:hypothetical protein
VYRLNSVCSGGRSQTFLLDISTIVLLLLSAGECPTDAADVARTLRKTTAVLRISAQAATSTIPGECFPAVG